MEINLFIKICCFVSVNCIERSEKASKRMLLKWKSLVNFFFIGFYFSSCELFSFRFIQQQNEIQKIFLQDSIALVERKITYNLILFVFSNIEIDSLLIDIQIHMFNPNILIKFQYRVRFVCFEITSTIVQILYVSNLCSYSVSSNQFNSFHLIIQLLQCETSISGIAYKFTWKATIYVRRKWFY